MLGRKKKPAAAPTQNDTIPATVSPRRPSAAEAHALVHAAVMGRDAAARLYLVLSETVGQGGVADAWRFMYLLPGVHAEAEALVSATLMPSGAYRISSVWDVVPFPRPGSTEAIMARGGPLAAKMAEERWEARLQRLKGLDDRQVRSVVHAGSEESAPVLRFALHEMSAMLDQGQRAVEVEDVERLAHAASFAACFLRITRRWRSTSFTAA